MIKLEHSLSRTFGIHILASLISFSGAIASVMTACDDDGTSSEQAQGVWEDPETGLMWQDPPSEITDFRYNCRGLKLGGYSDWRLPTIEELITLIRGCQDGVSTGDQSPSLCEMRPLGCVEKGTCDSVVNCAPCLSAKEHCLWNSALRGGCSGLYYSSTRTYAEPNEVWGVGFASGVVNMTLEEYAIMLHRCVRGQRSTGPGGDVDAGADAGADADGGDSR